MAGTLGGNMGLRHEFYVAIGAIGGVVLEYGIIYDKILYSIIGIVIIFCLISIEDKR